MNKDYYEILGVLDNAEDIVIRAAYRALAQRYHPDKWVGNPEEASRKMIEINQAYTILSDPIRRKQYDATRDSTKLGDDDNDFDFTSEIKEKWSSAVEYFPDLKVIHSRLLKISKALANSYQLTLIEKKEFERREELAKFFENTFLKKYFGTNLKIIEYAKKLISDGNKDALKELNRAVELLGSEVDPYVIIGKIDAKYYPLSGINSNLSKNVHNVRIYKSNRTEGNATALINGVGGSVDISGLFLNKYLVAYKGKSWSLDKDELLLLADTISKDISSKEESFKKR